MLDGAADAAAGGKWIMLLPLGRFAGRDGRGPYDAGTAEAMKAVVAATLQRAGTADLVVDYDHQSIFAAVPEVGGQAPAAGWIKEFEVRDDGLYGRVEWTARASRAIRQGEYRYISPVYHHDKSGKVTRLLHAGLTNTPNLDLAAVAASTTFSTEETPMLKNIALALGLAEAASEADILTAINSSLTSASAIAVAAGLPATAKGTEVLTAVQSAAAAKTAQVDPTKFVPVEQVTALQTEINSLKGRMDGDAAETAVNKAISDGKLAPALKTWALDYHKADPAKFKTFVDGSPVLTSAQRASATPPNGNSADADLTDEDIAVMKQMGLDRETFLKVKKAGDE